MNFRDVNAMAYVLLTIIFTEQHFLTPLPPIYGTSDAKPQ